MIDRKYESGMSMYLYPARATNSVYITVPAVGVWMVVDSINEWMHGHDSRDIYSVTCLTLFVH